MVFGFPDRPLPPRNLDISKIKAESCYLNWDAPLDDGGSELTNYIIEKKEIIEIDEDEVTESGEPVPKPDWVKVTNTIVEKKYGVSMTTISVVMHICCFCICFILDHTWLL